jgi:hypothetical protein
MGTQTQSLTLQTAPVYWQSYGKVAHRLQNITPRSPTKDPSGWTNGRFQRIYLPRKQVYISGGRKLYEPENIRHHYTNVGYAMHKICTYYP